MQIDMPDGFEVTSFGGDVGPGTQIHVRRQADNVPFVGTVQADGTVQMALEPQTVHHWPASTWPAGGPRISRVE